MLAMFRDTIEGRGKRIFAYANAHALNIARNSPEFREFLNSAAVTYPDGQGVCFAAKFLDNELPQPTALTRWIWDIAAFCAQNGYSLFLLGGTEQNAARAAERLRGKHPELRISSHHGYFSSSEEIDVLNKISAANPNILLVGFGMPRQEMWIQEHLASLPANVILPAGGAIDVAAGARPVPPRWISRGGLEWLFRLACEPRRLFKRYAFGNVQFLFAVYKQRAAA